MKKIFLYSALASLTLFSCRKDDNPTYKEPEDIATQDSYDNQAIQKFLHKHYLDDSGNIKIFDDNDPSDDNNTPLISLNPVTLPSGVIYIVRNGAQPTSGTSIGSTDIIRMMNKGKAYLAYSVDDNVDFYSSAYDFDNTIDGPGVPSVDPMYYYVTQSTIDNMAAGKTRSYFEIEGLREGLQHFQAFDQPDSASYNLQGVIIVPSRAAFARDPHYSYGGYNYRNRTFVFNFQIYKSTPRP